MGVRAPKGGKKGAEECTPPFNVTPPNPPLNTAHWLELNAVKVSGAITWPTFWRLFLVQVPYKLSCGREGGTVTPALVSLLAVAVTGNALPFSVTLAAH